MRLLTSQRSVPKQQNPSLREREKRRLATVMAMVTTTMDTVIMEAMDMVITMALAMVAMAIESRGVKHLAGMWGNRGTSTVLSRWIWFMANSRQASRPCTWVTSDDPPKHRGLQ